MVDAQTRREIPSPKRPLILPAGFWKACAAARQRLLMLDYDGTIAPHRTNRMEAHPVEGVPELLHRLQQQAATKVAIISGRPLGELVSLIGFLGVRLFGVHGFEVQGECGSSYCLSLLPQQVQQLQKAFDLALLHIDRKLLERKHGSVTVHTRCLPLLEAKALETFLVTHWREELGEQYLQIRYFRGGLELRAKGRDKEMVLNETAEAMPAGSFIAYLGDDQTDEEVFGNLPVGSYGIKVGGLDEATSASGRIYSCDYLPQFLEKWLHHCAKSR